MKFKPSKIICIGLNYRDHADELKMEIPKSPLQKIDGQWTRAKSVIFYLYGLRKRGIINLNEP